MEKLFYILSLTPSFVTTMLVFYMQRRQKRRDQEAAEMHAARQREYELKTAMDIAVRDMAYITALYVRDGKTNGDMDKVIGKYLDAKKEWKAFMLSQGHEHLLND